MNTKENKGLEKYKELLQEHDWFYEMTDDIRVYDNGKFNHDRLVRLSNTNDEYKKAYDEARNNKFNKVTV